MKKAPEFNTDSNSFDKAFEEGLGDYRKAHRDILGENDRLKNIIHNSNLPEDNKTSLLERLPKATVVPTEEIMEEMVKGRSIFLLNPKYNCILEQLNKVETIQEINALLNLFDYLQANYMVQKVLGNPDVTTNIVHKLYTQSKTWNFSTTTLQMAFINIAKAAMDQKK